MYFYFLEDQTIQKKLCDNPNHSLTISDTDYLRIIKKTIDISKSKVLDQHGQNCSDFYLTNTLSIKDINDYWKQFMYAFPEDRLVLWDVFDKAIKKYYQTLHRMHKYINKLIYLFLFDRIFCNLYFIIFSPLQENERSRTTRNRKYGIEKNFKTIYGH
jgi:hypothetical protein